MCFRDSSNLCETEKRLMYIHYQITVLERKQFPKEKRDYRHQMIEQLAINLERAVIDEDKFIHGHRPNANQRRTR